jgi:hypothetical protein
MAEHIGHDEFGGLQRDLVATGAAMGRRRWLRIAGSAAGALGLFGCGNNPAAPGVVDASAATTSSTTAATSAATGSGTCSLIPSETAGPFPGDGSNGPNVLSTSGVVRSDIRSSFAGLSGTADGIPLNIVLTIVSSSTCAPLAGRAVYLWH